MCSIDDLPNELLVLIFVSALCPILSTDYIPFSHQQSESYLCPSDTNITIYLSLVCHRWNAVLKGSGFLFVDLTITPGNVSSLVRALSDIPSDNQIIHRVVLPYSSTATPSPALPPSIQVLSQYCDSLIYLLRPHEQSPSSIPFEFETNCPSFLSLRRLEWWHCQYAERSGGINSLGIVLSKAPILEYLFIGRVLSIYEANIQRYAISLPLLHTLRLNSIRNVYLLGALAKWTLPNLRTLILDSPDIGPYINAPMGLVHLWENWGDNLHTVQFGKHMRFLVNDHVFSCLSRCHSLRQLNYYVLFTSPISATAQNDTLETVGLHFACNESMGLELGPHLQKHFNHYLNVSAFPHFRTFQLFGKEWTTLNRENSGTSLVELTRQVQAQGISLEMMD